MRHADTEQQVFSDSAIPSDERWVPVASAPGMDPGRSLEPVYEALCEAGIPAGFDPYRPGTASNPYPVVQRLYHVVVPESRLMQAKDALRDMHVEVPAEGAGSRVVQRTASQIRWRRVAWATVVLILLVTVIEYVVSLLYQTGVLD